jgi:O-methyltransferase
VKSCLDNLYHKVSNGGIIQFDDYGYWKGARKAVDEFLDARGIRAPLKKLDYSGRILVKPLSSSEP